MKTIKNLLSILLLFMVVSSAMAHKKGNDNKGDKEISLPYDSTTGKYTYVRIIETPGKPAEELYKAAKDWSKIKFSDDKYLIDEQNTKFIHMGNFTITVKPRGGMGMMPYVYTIVYNLGFYYKDGKSKIQVTSIRISQNAQATTQERTIEAFETQMEDVVMGKRVFTAFVMDCFKEIDIQIKKVLDEAESALKNGNQKKDDW